MAIIELKVPSIGESITEVSLSKWLKPNGSMVEMDEVICVFESDKASLELPSEAAGKLIHVAKEGDDLKIGAVVAMVEPVENSIKSEAPKPKPELANPSDTEKNTGNKDKIVQVPSPSAAKIMREKGIELKEVVGTGRDGRITKTDVIHLATEKKEITKEETNVVVNSLKLQGVFSRETKREKMSRMRRTIAKRLVSAKNNTAMLTTFNEVDMQALIDLRTRYNELYQTKYGIKIGYMSLFAKACAMVLMEMPEVNAQIDGDDLIIHDYVDIALAISTPNGLVVPPIHNVESLALWDFEQKLKTLADKARNGSLGLEEMTGGTFTITNGGVFGSLMSTPIINEPQSAILGMHAIKERAMVVNGQIQSRPMMYLALSYDHRVIDGSSSVRFLVKVKELLEDPMRMFLEI